MWISVAGWTTLIFTSGRSILGFSQANNQPYWKTESAPNTSICLSDLKEVAYDIGVFYQLDGIQRAPYTFDGIRRERSLVNAYNSIGEGLGIARIR